MTWQQRLQRIARRIWTMAHWVVVRFGRTLGIYIHWAGQRWQRVVGSGIAIELLGCLMARKTFEPILILEALVVIVALILRGLIRGSFTR